MTPRTEEGPIAIANCDILASDKFEAIANPVNCAGTMGAGLARKFAGTHPEILPAYRRACRTGKLRPGQVMLHRLRRSTNPLYVVQFPTKDHWNGNSRLAWIAEGLNHMYPQLESEEITTLALPALGTGYGNLPWHHVKALIEQAAADHPTVKTTVCLLPPRISP